MRKLLRLSTVAITGGYGLLLALHLLLRVTLADRYWLLALMNNFTPYYFLPLIVLLPFMLLMRSWRTSVLLGVLFTMAVVAYGPRFVPRATATPTGQTLRVLTFNVWSDINSRLDELDNWLREQNADIVMLQEIPVSYPESELQNLYDLYPYQFLETRSWGNIILSRYPILNYEWLTIHPRVVLDINGQPVSVYNIHFRTPIRTAPRLRLPFNITYVNLMLRYDDNARNAEIREFLPTLQNEPYPFIVAGDFNMSDQAAIYPEVARYMRDSYAEVGYGMGTTWRNWSFHRMPLSLIPPLSRIDYVWHSSHFQALRAEVGAPFGSDHLPLLVTLQLAQ